MNYTIMCKHSKRLASAAALLAATALLGTPAMALESDRDKPIQVSADGGELDARTGFTRFTGSVDIQQGTLEVKSDTANVYTEQGEITRILLKGDPATWRQQLESRKWMRAEASEIDYDRSEETILLIGDAYVDHPQGEMSGDRFTYDLETEKLRGASDTGGRIQMRLEPDVMDSGISRENRPDVAEPRVDSNGDPETDAASGAEDTPASDSQDDSGDGNEPDGATAEPDAIADPAPGTAKGDTEKTGAGSDDGADGDSEGNGEADANTVTAGEAGAADPSVDGEDDSARAGAADGGTS